MGEQKVSQFGDLAEMESQVLRFLREGEGFFDDLILKVHFWQRTACVPYGAWCASFPLPSSWREIPAIPLAAFRQTAIRSFPAAETTRTFRTSGTTGEGYGEHHFRTVELYRAAVLGGWGRAGLPAENVLCLLRTPENAPHSSLGCMAGWLAPRENFFWGHWEALCAKVEAASGRFSSSKSDTEAASTILFGTALAFLDFFEFLDDRSLALPPGSLAVETGGYKGTRRDLPKADLYALFEKKLGLPPASVWNEYGMTELSSQFYTHDLGNPHSGAPWIRTMVIDPATEREVADGGTGVLRIFDLANTGSCCAIQTRDLAIRRGENFELLGRDPAALPRGCSRAADEMLATEK